MIKSVRVASFMIGTLLIILSLFMLISAFTDIYFKHNPNNFYNSAFITAWCAFTFIRFGSIETIKNTNMQVVTSAVWIAISLFSGIPIFLETKLSIVDAIFESVSGITTTGATILSHIETHTQGLLLWRALLHFFGGAGIILTGIIIFPIFKNTALNAIVSSELHDEKLSIQHNVFYNPFKTAVFICVIYLALNILCFVSYLLAGMPMFDAICHAMSTASTGGFANYDDSIGYYKDITIETICAIFMILSAMPFSSYIHLPKKITITDQGKFYLRFIVLMSIASSAAIYINEPSDSLPLPEVIRGGIFTSVSLMTSAGFFNFDYSYMHYIWVIGAFAMLIGGCSQSTAGGIKINRFMIAVRNIKNTTMNAFNPHILKVLVLDEEPIDQKVVLQTYNYIFLYLLTIAIAATILSMTGLDFTSSIASAISSISNSGFGFGSVSLNYEDVSQTAKIVLSCTMIFGRLENLILSVLFIVILDSKGH